MNTDGIGFYTYKECHQTESLWNHITTDHKEEKQLEDQRKVGENSCNSGDGTDQRVQSLMFMVMMTKLQCLSDCTVSQSIEAFSASKQVFKTYLNIQEADIFEKSIWFWNESGNTFISLAADICEQSNWLWSGV
jgi:hypothetical protein